MTEIIASLADIGARYDALFCDLWGCVHNGVVAYPEAVAALEAYRCRGGLVVLMTNAPRPAADVTRHFGRMGLSRDAWDIIVTSGDASRAAMFHGAVGHRVHHIGPPEDEGFFTDMADGLEMAHIERVPLRDAEGIVCTGLLDDENDSPEDYRATLLFAKTKGMKLLCTNPDIQVDKGDRRLWCAGAIAKLYEEMGGESIYCGKPHPPIYDLARVRLAALRPIDHGAILCVGDGVLTDLRGGMGEGLDTLFITGGLAEGEFGADPEAPDEALLEAWLARHQSAATWAMPKLR